MIVETARGDGRLTGASLVTGPQDAKAAAFSRLTASRLASCYRLATVILGDPAEAEDATHDAAVRAWERWGSLRDSERFDAWFGRILVNECRDRLRRRKTRPNSLPLLDRHAGGIPDDIDGLAERHALAEAVDRLEPDQRIAVILHYYLGLTAEQIAERTETRVGTVKSRLHYAVAALRAGRDAAARIEGNGR
jgi:RNA polymerase sigma-70 factor, ECF subfamily